MKNTRLMDRLFSSTSEKDEELNEQVAKDIETARENGVVDTDELTFKNEGDNKVSILDKENGETTIAEKAEDGNYELYPAEYNPTEQPEGFIHPEGDGVTPGNQEGAPDEHVEEHLDGTGVAESIEPVSVEETAQIGPSEEETCPECGENPCKCEEKKDEEEKEFCDSSNTVVQRIFSDQLFMERLFSEVIESEETAKVGDLKIEKVDGEENTIVVTDENSGDQAKVELTDDEMEVTELDSKNFSEEGETEGPEEYSPIHVVGVDAFNHVLVDSPCYSEEQAQELAEQLAEDGVDGIQMFDDEEDARDYAIDLLDSLGAQNEEGLDIEEPEEVTYSDHTIYLTKYYSDHTVFMDKMFSEACCDIEVSQAKIEDALENGDEIETETEIVTPIDSKTAVVQDKDNDEYTKVTIKDDNMDLSPLSEDEAADLMEDIEVEDTDEDEDQKEYSDIWCNEAETKFFSENEYMTDFMCRLFSDEADEEEIVDAIKSGDEIEKDSEIITPIDSETAVIEDKENGEFTLAKLDEDEDLDVRPISKEKATDMMENLKVEDTDKDEDQKEYSDIWCNEAETKFFSENEPMTDYMVRLFSEEADEKEIEKAIETGEQVEAGSDVITPVDDKTAVIVDTENNEFTKATMDDEKLDVEPITEEEADELIGSEEPKEDEKTYSNPILDKFFADAVNGMAQGDDDVVMARIDPATGQLVPVEEETSDQPQMTVEAIEDKALAAVQSIQAAAAECEATILNAKAAPAETEQANLQEAQFSDTEEAGTQKTFSNTNDDTLVSWLHCHDTKRK